MGNWLIFGAIFLTLVWIWLAIVLGQIRIRTYLIVSRLCGEGTPRPYHQQEMIDIIFNAGTIRKNFVNKLVVLFVLETECHYNGYFIKFERNRDGAITLCPYTASHWI